MKKPYYALSDDQKQKVHEARIAAKYTYKKWHFTLDQTYYYNKMRYDEIQG